MNLYTYKKNLLMMVVLLPSLFLSQTIINYSDSLEGFDEIQIKNASKNYGIVSNELSVYLASKKRQYINSRFKLDESKNNYKSLGPLSPLSSTNIDFETANMSSWTINTATNKNSTSIYYCCVTSGGKAHTVPSTANDPICGFNLSSPLGGNQVAKIGNDTLVGSRLTMIRNKINVTTADNLLKFAYACVFGSAGHECNDQPYMSIRLTDTLGNVYFNYFIEAKETATSACQGYNSTGSFSITNWYCLPWQTRCVDLSPYLGKTIVLEVIAAECSLSAHKGYGYFDASLGTCPESGLLNYVTIDGNQTSFNNNYLYLNNTACLTPSINISAPSWPSSYLWNGPPGSGVTGLTTQTINATKGGYYTLSMSSSSTCPITKTIKVAEFTVPTLSISFTPTICLGQKTTLIVSGADSYTWSTGALGPSTTVMPTVTTTYSVQGINQAGCKDTISFTVPVIPPPSVAILGPTLLCQGDTATLTASGASTYTWNTLSNNLAIIVTPSVNTVYTLTGKDAFGCANSTSIALTVNNPSLSVSHTSATICIGSTITFTSGGANTYTWSTGSNSSFINVAPTTNTVYFLSATNACGVYSKTINVTVNPVPTVNISPPTSTLLCQGIAYTITASGASNYTWSGPGIISSNQYANPCSITNNAFGLATYTLKGALGGCTGTTSITFSVNPSPTVSLVSPIGTNGCSGVTNTVYVTGGINYTFAPSTSPTTITTNPYFVWTPNPGFNTCYIYGDNALGCWYRLTYFLNANPTSYTIAATANTNTVCSSGSATLNAVGAASSYTWSNGVSGYSTVVTPTATTIYTLTGHSTCGFLTNTIAINYLSVNGPTVSINTVTNNICPKVPFTMTVSGANTYTWSDGSTAAIKSITNPITSTTYSVLGQDSNGCVSLSSFSLNVLSSPTVSFVNPSDTMCIGSTSILSVSGAVSYSWSTGSTSYTTAFTPLTGPFSYPYVTGYDINGCSTTNTLTVRVFSATPIVTSTVYPICPFEPAVLTASALSTSNFTWSTGAVSKSISITPSVTTTYTVSNNYYAPLGCIRSTIATVSVITNPIVSVLSSTSACAGSNPVPIISNFSQASGTLIGTYVSGNSFYPLFPGTYKYYLVVKDSVSGCFFSSTVNTITVVPGTPVSLTAGQYTTCVGSSLTLSGSPPGGNYSGISISSNSFLPTTSGQYCLFYNFTDANGCSSYDQKCFYAYTCTNVLNNTIEEQNLTIQPNPAHEYFQINNSLYENLELFVFDLNGKTVLSIPHLNFGISNIDISKLSAGIYYIRMRNSDVESFTLKLIKLN